MITTSSQIWQFWVMGFAQMLSSLQIHDLKLQHLYIYTSLYQAGARRGDMVRYSGGGLRCGMSDCEFKKTSSRWEMGYYGFCLLTDTWMMIIIITPCFSLVAAAAALWTTTRESSVVELHSLPQVGFFYKVEPPTQAAHEMDPAKKNTFNTPLDKQWVGINFEASFLISIQSIFWYMDAQFFGILFC